MKKSENAIVKKSNAIIRAHWNITSIWEPRIVALLASKIRVEDSDFQTYRLHISEILAGTGQKIGGRNYKEIDEAIEKIMEKTIEVRGDNPNQRIRYALFSMCLIDEKEGYLEVRFDADLKPHFLDLKERFTQYSFAEFMKLPSTYSQRLFEILSSWKNIKEGEVSISMSELHAQLDSPPSLKKNFKDFRMRVLEQAHEDMTQNEKTKTNLDFEWQPIKQGRKVIAVKFIFDKGKISAIRRAREKEAWHELRSMAEKCSINMSGLSEIEQDKMQREQRQEVCNLCNDRGIAKTNLFPLECKRYAKVEILNSDGSPMTTFETEQEVSEPSRELEKSSNEQILEAYLKATDGRFNELRFISAVHHYLPDMTRAELGKHMLQMQRGKKCTLNYYGNPGALPRVDKESPIMCGGTPRHTIFIEEEK